MGVGRIHRLSSALVRLACLLFALGLCSSAAAQGAEKTDQQPPAQASEVEQVPRVPGVAMLLRGFNAGFTFSQTHDSSAGWYNVATPAVSYTFSRHYSADASASIYPYRRIQNTNPAVPPNQRLVVDLGDVGDTLVGFHATFNPHEFWTTTTASFTIPTGDRSDGLSTGRVTFDLNQHLERYIKQTGFLIDIGGGDSSGLVNRLVTKEDDSLGPLVHFRAGIDLYQFWGWHFQSVAYEQLPIGSQQVYNAVSPPGVPSQPEVTGTGVSEDNGFTTSVGIPLTDHLTLSGYYNRSLRQHTDTVSTGITYVLRGTRRKKRLSLIDRAIREAEGASN